MYKNILKKLDEAYDHLIRIQYNLISYKRDIENNPNGNEVEFKLSKIESLQKKEKRKIEYMKEQIRILEKIIDELEM